MHSMHAALPHSAQGQYEPRILYEIMPDTSNCKLSSPSGNQTVEIFVVETCWPELTIFILGSAWKHMFFVS